MSERRYGQEQAPKVSPPAPSAPAPRMQSDRSRLARVRDWTVIVTCAVLLVLAGVSAYVFVSMMNALTADVAPAQHSVPALTGESCADMLDGECR